jgi:hypothetical protein
VCQIFITKKHKKIFIPTFITKKIKSKLRESEKKIYLINFVLISFVLLYKN